MSAESEKAPNVVQAILAAVDRLPDSEAAQLDEAAKTVAALVEALKDLLPEAGKNFSDADTWSRHRKAVAALKAAGEEL